MCEKGGCPLYSSCKVCAHTVAVARHTGTVDEYIKWLQRHLSVTSLADLNMPKGAGKKPHRKASQKSSMKRVKGILAQEHKEMTPRVPTLTDHSATTDEAQENEMDVSPSHYGATDDFDSPGTFDAPYEMNSPEYHPPYETDIPGSSYPPSTSPASCSSEQTCGQNQAIRMPPPLLSVGPLLNTRSMSICSPGASAVVNMQIPPETRDIFWLQFVKGNILCCNGCGKRNLRGEDGKPRPPPQDLCVQHKEYVLFENPHTGKYQMSMDLRNVYYHAIMTCIRQKNPHFYPDTIRSSNDIKAKLTGIHYSHLLSQFGLSFLNK